jgi:Ca2+-binding RTX toxin-like protein
MLLIFILWFGAFALQSEIAFAACSDNKCVSQSCTICGTSGNNTLNGTAGNDVICGLAGNDIINGKDGDDKICGGTGNDTIYGGNGDDHIIGDAGYDYIYGQNDDDIINCTVSGTFYESGEADGGAGRDQIYGCGIGYGGPGNDYLTGTPSGDYIVGGDGNDQLFGSNADDSLDIDSQQSGGTDYCNGQQGSEDTCDCETNVNCES